MKNPTDIKNFGDLAGHTMAEVTQIGDDEIVFVLTTGEAFRLYHRQDCCESVTIEDVTGDLADLVGVPLLVAEERSNRDDPPNEGGFMGGGFHTWTFYEMRTLRGSVTLRWLGESNGYYSESVDFDPVAR